MGGGNKRRRKSSKKAAASSPTADDTTKSNNGVRVYIESTTDVSPPPSAWSANFVQNIDKKTPTYSTNKDDDVIPSIMDIGLQMVKGTLERISSKRNKKARKRDVLQGASSSDAKPTDVQLNLWPALLHSFQSKVNDNSSTNHHHLNVVGIAPTGTGKTLSYSIPIVSLCLHSLLSIPATNSINVHGVILVPTRELATQVSKEMNVVAKVANKYIAKYYKNAATDDDVKEKKIESKAIYGGVDIETQIATLLGKGEEKESSCGHTSLVVAATAGRLLDILKQTNSEDESTVSSAASAFANLQAIVFDEADRIAVNTDMASQVDEILSILKSVRKDSSSGGDVVSCLVSATLPDKAKEICEIWVPRNRIVVMVNSVQVGDNEKQSTKKKSDSDCNATKEDNAEESPKAMSAAEEEQGSKKRNNLDLSSIPSNIVQTLHVCSAHKKPKKLIVTLQRIYKPKHQQQQRSSSSSSNGERFSANNRLTIVFFKQIKTVKYVSQLLVKEGLKCAELYGSLPQSEREKRLLEFKAGKTPILLATDIAARGIHVNNVYYVVNYDFPGSLDQYVHRCGRAGRKQALSGETSQYPPTVYSFFTREFSAMADSVIELLKACNAWIDPNLLALSKERQQPAEGKSGSSSGRKKKRKSGEVTNSNKARKERKMDSKVLQGGTDDASEDEDNQFAFLGKSVLKRADVSEAEDSADESSS